MSELFRPLAWLQPVADLGRLGVFLAFLVLGLRARDRRSVGRFLGYALAVSFAAGLVQQESWPFTQWALVHNPSPRRAVSWELQGEASGRTYVIDPRILQPLAPEEFGAWMLANVERLPAAGSARLGRELLARAEAARLRLLAGGRVARNEWLLGPLTAPYHFLPGVTWDATTDVPSTPFEIVRIWRLEWDVEERRAHDERVVRRLLLEYAVPRPESP